MARRPRTDADPGLSRDAVVAAAFDLVDSEGVEALSIRRLAARLGVRGPSLYYHFRSKAELVDLLVDVVLEATLGEIDPAGLGRGQGRDWRRWLERLARSYRDILRRHRGLTSLVALRLPSGPNGVAIYDATLDVLLKAGFRPRQALAAYVTVCDYVLSAVQRESVPTGAVWSLEEMGRLAQAIADAPGDHVALAAVAGEALRLSADELFDFGLSALLDGISSRP